MRNRYWQTLLTYEANEQGPFQWNLLAALLLMTTAQLVYQPMGSGEFSNHLFGLLIFFLMYWRVGVHLRGQFVDARATILPRFRATSLSVAVLAWGLVLAWSVVFTWRTADSSADRTIRFLLLISALGLWAGYCGPWAMNFVGFVMLASLIGLSKFDESFSNAWIHGPDAPAFSVPVALLAVAALVALGVRLMHVREGMADYDWSDPSDEKSAGWKPRPGATHPARRAGRWWRNSYWFAPSDRAIRRLRRSPPNGLIGHASRWAAAQRLRWRIGSFGLLLLLLLAVQSGWRRGEFRVTWSDVSFIQFFAAPITLAVLGRRVEFLKMEILRPARRSRFFVTVGLAVAAIHAIAWLVINLALIATIGYFRPELLATRELWQSVLVSAAFQPFVLGVVAWMSRYRHFPIEIPLLLIPIVVFPVVILFFWNPTGPTWLRPSIFAAIFLAIGSALTIDAWRRWARTEFV